MFFETLSDNKDMDFELINILLMIPVDNRLKRMLKSNEK